MKYFSKLMRSLSIRILQDRIESHEVSLAVIAKQRENDDQAEKVLRAELNDAKLILAIKYGVRP